MVGEFTEVPIEEVEETPKRVHREIVTPEDAGGRNVYVERKEGNQEEGP